MSILTNWSSNITCGMSLKFGVLQFYHDIYKNILLPKNIKTGGIICEWWPSSIRHRQGCKRSDPSNIVKNIFFSMHLSMEYESIHLFRICFTSPAENLI
jgi:hypothetical protein